MLLGAPVPLNPSTEAGGPGLGRYVPSTTLGAPCLDFETWETTSLRAALPVWNALSLPKMERSRSSQDGRRKNAKQREEQRAESYASHPSQRTRRIGRRLTLEPAPNVSVSNPSPSLRRTKRGRTYPANPTWTSRKLEAAFPFAENYLPLPHNNNRKPCGEPAIGRPDAPS